MREESYLLFRDIENGILKYYPFTSIIHSTLIDTLPIYFIFQSLLLRKMNLHFDASRDIGCQFHAIFKGKTSLKDV